MVARIITRAETQATHCAEERCDRESTTAVASTLSATEIFRRDKEARRRRPSPGVRGTRRSPARPSPSQRSADVVSAEDASGQVTYPFGPAVDVWPRDPGRRGAAGDFRLPHR